MNKIACRVIRLRESSAKERGFSEGKTIISGLPLCSAFDKGTPVLSCYRLRQHLQTYINFQLSSVNKIA